MSEHSPQQPDNNQQPERLSIPRRIGNFFLLGLAMSGTAMTGVPVDREFVHDPVGALKNDSASASPAESDTTDQTETPAPIQTEHAKLPSIPNRRSDEYREYIERGLADLISYAHNPQSHYDI